jgi:hypothetical protein
VESLTRYLMDLTTLAPYEFLIPMWMVLRPSLMFSAPLRSLSRDFPISTLADLKNRSVMFL